MKTIVAAAAAASLAIALQSATVLAAGPKASGSNAIFQPAETQVLDRGSAASHYEWQYHYVGRHGRFAGYWVLVH